MAIEIRELVIKAIVTKEIDPQKEKSLFQSNEAKKLKREIVADCMEQVKEYLDDLKSR